MSTGGGRCDVLIVGAGPTGLTLAAQLARFGVSCRIIDKNTDRAHESRALGVQPRTLEVLHPFGLADELVRHGNPAVQLRLHAGARVTSSKLFDIGMHDTAYPFLLFISQARIESVVLDHLAGRGIRVERRTELKDYSDAGDGGDLTCRLSTPDGATTVRARYVVGCDGAHSAVRKISGTDFEGGRYPQTFLLADLAVDGLEPDAIHAYVGPNGPLLFFPLKEPAPWRLITLRPADRSAADERAREAEPTTAGPVSVGELQAACAAATTDALQLHEPLWATAFSVHHRHAGRYRADRIFLAGDAAHIHSPAGAQGMNTGIQDAINLGWKLALVSRGDAPDTLLDSYDAERRPVGAFVLRFTDRAFTAATSPHPLFRAARTHAAPRLVPLALRFSRGRALVFRTVSQLQIRYRRSPAIDVDRPSQKYRLSPLRFARGPRAGDRLPDARVVANGVERWLHDLLLQPAFHLLLCGPADSWDERRLNSLEDRFGALLVLHRLDQRPAPGVLTDATGRALGLLGVRSTTQLVVRPDGHIGCRTDGPDLTHAESYLTQWIG